MAASATPTHKRKIAAFRRVRTAHMLARSEQAAQKAAWAHSCTDECKGESGASK